MKIRIKTISWHLWLVLPFLEPLLFKEYATVDRVFDVLKLAAFFIILVLYLQKRRVSGFIILVLAQQGAFFLSTILGEYGNLTRYAGPAISVVAVALWAELVARRLDDVVLFLSRAYMLLIIGNIITLVLYYPEGIATPNGVPTYFLGIVNRFVFYFLPFCCYLMMRSRLKGKQLSGWVILWVALCTGQLLWAWSVGAMLGMLLLLAYVLFSRYFPFFEKARAKTYLACIVVLNLLVVVFRAQTLVEGFVTQILNKDVTLTYRTGIWDTVFALFKEQPLLGYGIESINISNLRFGGVAHAHNVFVDSLYNGGLIGFLLTLAVFAFVAVRLAKSNSPLGGDIAFCIFIVWFLSIADGLDYAMIYALYAFACHASEYDDRVCIPCQGAKMRPKIRFVWGKR